MSPSMMTPRIARTFLRPSTCLLRTASSIYAGPCRTLGALRMHHCPPGQDQAADTPLNADAQPNATGVQPSYGPIGVTAALKHHADGTSFAPPPYPMPPLLPSLSLPSSTDPAPTPTLLTHEFSLKDRVALVSGANRGLGLEMALALVEGGARAVYCVDLAKEPSPTFEAVRAYAQQLKGTGGEGRMEYISGDVTDQVSGLLLCARLYCTLTVVGYSKRCGRSVSSWVTRKVGWTPVSPLRGS